MFFLLNRERERLASESLERAQAGLASPRAWRRMWCRARAAPRAWRRTLRRVRAAPRAGRRTYCRAQFHGI